MKTANGIYLNLKESNYCVIKYGLIFYFSSVVYRDKFQNNVSNYVENEKLKLKNRYSLSVIFDVFLAISYYKRIEKRGFRVTDNVNKKEMTKDVVFIEQIFKY